MSLLSHDFNSNIQQFIQISLFSICLNLVFQENKKLEKSRFSKCDEMLKMWGLKKFVSQKREEGTTGDGTA